jgi:hypothetical protein
MGGLASISFVCASSPQLDPATTQCAHEPLFGWLFCKSQHDHGENPTITLVSKQFQSRLPTRVIVVTGPNYCWDVHAGYCQLHDNMENVVATKPTCFVG